MSEENNPEKKLKKLTGTDDLSSAIERLEKKKNAMEDDFKKDATRIFEKLKSVNLLNKTLHNVDELSPPDSSLFKKSFAFGAGYLSKRKMINQFKKAIIKTFKISTKQKDLILSTDDMKEEIMKNNEESANNKNDNIDMNSNIEKVKSKPEVLPEPTYWPFFLALGIVFLGWGLLTTWLISLAGFIIMITALTGWINILRHE